MISEGGGVSHLCPDALHPDTHTSSSYPYSDPTYVIPEEERMNPPRKRLQMLALEEAIFNVKMDFNGRFLALREVKKKVGGS